jgi:hypothetical protein
MGSQPRGPPGAVSKRMLVVIVLMLLVIIVPVTLVGLSMSKIMVTVTNMDSQSYVQVVVWVSHAPDGHSSFDLGPEEARAVSFTVAVGSYTVDVDYRYLDQGWYQGQTKSCGVSLLETEEAEFRLYPPYVNVVG